MPFSFNNFHLRSIVVVLGPLTNAILLTHMNKLKEQQRTEILAQYANDRSVDRGMRA